MTEFRSARAAKIMIFLDGQCDSLNDGGFAVGMSNPEWIDWPGTYHNFGRGFAFADGHSEVHKWKDGRTRVIGGNVSRKSVPGSPDWQWVAEHTWVRVK